MKPFTGILNCLGLLTLIAFLAFDIAAQTASSSGSTIRGKAIYDDTERPVRRAQVQRYAEGAPYQSRSTVTDGSGEFEIKNVVAGEYKIMVGYPGANGYYGIEVNDRQATNVTVDGSGGTDVKVRVVRAAAITGKITYPDGEPVIGAQINVYTKVGNQWTDAPISSHGAYSDDRGVYRIYPLKAGEYIVSVIEQSLTIEERDGGSIQTVSNKSLTPYFYPDAISFKTAQVLKLEVSQELTNINLVLTERATYRVAGTLTLRGKPLADAYVKLDARDDVTSGPTLDRTWGTFAKANKDGQWFFDDVPDGNYEIVLDPMRDSSFSVNGIVEKRPAFINQRQRVTVAGADVLDVAIALSDGGRISGRIIVEGDKPLPENLSVSAQLLKSKGEAAYARVDPKAKGAFLLEAVVPGENFLKMQLVGKGYFVKSITWRGRDLFNQSILVEEGKEATGVTIVLSTDVGTVNGQILDSSSKKPLARRMFILLPLDESNWNSFAGQVSGTTDMDGRFRVSGPPGEYIFVTIPDKPKLTSLEDLKRLTPQAPHVVLKVSEQPPVEIVARVSDR